MPDSLKSDGRQHKPIANEAIEHGCTCAVVRVGRHRRTVWCELGGGLVVHPAAVVGVQTGAHHREQLVIERRESLDQRASCVAAKTAGGTACSVQLGRNAVEKRIVFLANPVRGARVREGTQDALEVRGQRWSAAGPSRSPPPVLADRFTAANDAGGTAP